MKYINLIFTRYEELELSGQDLLDDFNQINNQLRKFNVNLSLNKNIPSFKNRYFLSEVCNGVIGRGNCKKYFK